MKASHPPGLRVVSYGGGVQSTALLVLAAKRRINFAIFLFANVGHDSEDPDTLHYLQTYAAPYAQHHGIQLVQLHRTRRDGSVETLHGRLTRPGSRSLPIPVRMSSGAPGTRSCTADFKIAVIGKWLKAHGASASNPATVGIGISLDLWRWLAACPLSTSGVLAGPPPRGPPKAASGCEEHRGRPGHEPTSK
jgi:hypothetical protein